MTETRDSDGFIELDPESDAETRADDEESSLDAPVISRTEILPLPVIIPLESITDERDPRISPPDGWPAGTSPVFGRRRRRGTDERDEPSPRRLKTEDEGGFLKNDEHGSQKKDDEEDGHYCPICFDNWSNTGGHRVVSLRCGHLFGQNCIERWIHSNGKGARCPQCNEVAAKRDVRPIYVRNLKAIDTSERDRALADLEAERETRRLTELECNKLRLQLAARDQDIARLQQELQQCRAALSGACLAASGQAELPLAGAGPLFGSQPPGILGKRLVLDATVELCKDGSCRVLTYSEYLNLLVASHAAANTQLIGAGIKKINALDGFRVCGYIPLHRKQIRDMSFHHEQHDLLLTVSLDKTARLVNVHSNSAVQTFVTDAPLWSCCWNTNNSFQFFTGTSNGKVLLFDTRKENHVVNSWTQESSMSPVTGLGYLPFSPVASFPRGGLFAERLTSCTFYEARGAEEFVPHCLPVEGPFSSLAVDPETRHILLSCKPSTSNPQVRHMVCAPSWTPGTTSVCSCQPVASIRGGSSQKYLSRSCLMAVPGSSEGKQLIVAAYQEETQSIHFWDVNSSSVMQKLPAPSPALDLVRFRVNGQEFFASLSEKQVHVYKWV